MIHNVDPQLSQWDVGRIVNISDSNATHVHFANQGDSKAVIIEIENGSAKIPDYLLQTGKNVIAYAVYDGVTLESRTFAVRKREKPESYVYEEDNRNYIYKLISDAETAVAAAKVATDNANKATKDANDATDNAKVAANNASIATNSANQAAKNANEATTKAVNAVKSMMVVGEAKGTPITIDNAIDQTLVGLRVFGKTTQNGTPTPDAPVELVSIGSSGSIAVSVTGENDAQSMTIATPNGLPGIPVASGGNYTDANGQQWICDEIDFARGIFIKRVAAETLSGSPDFRKASDWPGRFVYGGFLQTMYKDGNQMSFSNFAKWSRWALGEPGGSCFAVTSKLLYYYPATTMTETEVNELFAEMISSETPPVILAQLATPIETPLSEEELAAYANLHTYKGNTTVSNDAGAWMDLEYVMDAKKYIDSLVGPGGGGTATPARLASVTLPASAWVTETENLHYQVVTINGTTEYSKVDLLPSAEQLAIFHNKDVAFVTENEDGVVTVYAIGDKPQNDYTMQVSITEVEV